MPFPMIAVVVALVSILIAGIRLGVSGRVGVESVVVVASLYYVALSFIYGVVQMVNSLPWLAAIVVNTLLLYAIVRLGVYTMAIVCEGCSVPRERFTGEGSSISFRYGNMLLSLLIAMGMHGMGQFSPLPVWWLVVAAAVGLIAMLMAHGASGCNYGHEPDGSPRSSAEIPTKMFYDLMVYGVFVALHLVTWIPAVILTIVALLTGQAANLLLMIVIIIVLIAYVILKATTDSDLDYAKLYPEYEPHQGRVSVIWAGVVALVLVAIMVLAGL